MVMNADQGFAARAETIIAVQHIAPREGIGKTLPSSRRKKVLQSGNHHQSG
jgi:hypothetical protein